MSQKIKLSFSGISTTNEDPISTTKREISTTNEDPISTTKIIPISTTKVEDSSTKESTGISATKGAKMNAYIKQHYDRLQLNVPKGGKEELDQACIELGMKSKVQLLEKGVKALKILKKQAESQGKTLEMYMEEQKYSAVC